MYCPPLMNERMRWCIMCQVITLQNHPFGSSYKFTFDTYIDYTQLHIKQDLR